MSERGATAGSWKHEPMPPEREEIAYHDEFMDSEMEQIRLGYIPEVMEEKWFIYMEGDWLYLHRSWTGICVYMVRFEYQEGRYLIAEAWVNRDTRLGYWVSGEHASEELRFLIQLLLLNNNIGFPRKPGQSDEEAAIGMWSLVGKEILQRENKGI